MLLARAKKVSSWNLNITLGIKFRFGFQCLVLDQSVIGSGDESPSTATTKSDLTFGDDPFPRNKWVANKDRHIDDDPKPSKLFTYSHKRQKLKKTLDHFNDATVLALYGDNFETEPLLQARVRNFLLLFLWRRASF